MAAHRPVIYLHIGAMKTGTTYLQALLNANADALRDTGYLYPGQRGRYSQSLAARDVLNMTGDTVALQKARGEWDRIREEMLDFEGNASVFSKEFLSFARKDLAGTVVDSLDSAQVHGILTVRDAAATTPAQWQQGMQSKNTTSWAQFVDQITAEPPDAGTWGVKTFRRAQDIPRMLNAWLAHIPPERFTVVTVPGRGSPRRLLWERFAEANGVDPAVASRSAPRRNESIGAASAELLRRLNERLTDVRVSDYRPTMTNTLAANVPRIRSQRQRADPRRD